MISRGSDITIYNFHSLEIPELQYSSSSFWVIYPKISQIKSMSNDGLSTQKIHCKKSIKICVYNHALQSPRLQPHSGH